MLPLSVDHPDLPARAPAALPRLPRPERDSSELLRLSALLVAGDEEAIRRLAAGHVPGTDGMCRGHTIERREWPCWAVQVASVAERMNRKGY